MRLTTAIVIVNVLTGCSLSEQPSDSAAPGEPAALRGAHAFVLEDIHSLPSASGDFIGAQPGDLVLSNPNVVAVIRTAPTSLEIPGMQGGGLVDLYPPGAPDALREHFVIVALRGFRPESHEILAPGGEDKPAIVRLTGTDATLQIIPEDFPLQPPGPLDASISTEYSLGPADDYVTVSTTVFTQAPDASSFPVGDGIFASGPDPAFVPGLGFGLEEVARAPYIVVGGLARVGLPPSDDFVASVNNIVAVLANDPIIRPGQSTTFSRRFFVDDIRRPPSYLAARALDLQGTPTGQLLAESETADLRVEVSNAAGRVLAYGASGAAFPVPIGPVQVRAGIGERWGPSQAVETSADQLTTIRVTGPDQGKLKLSCVDTTSGLALPARALLVRAGGGTETHLIPPEGTEISVAPGLLEVLVSRGTDYEAHRSSLEIKVGETSEVSAHLERVVDTGDAIGADFHLHSIWSTDSRMPEARRILAVAAEGVALAVATDHDRITEYRIPTALAPWLQAISGAELSTANFGHFGSFPLQANPLEPRNGAPDWVGRDPTTLFAELARLPTSPVVIVNHPRRSDSGFFTAFGFGPEGMPLFDTGFDAVEVYNGKGGDQSDRVLEDMAALLNLGLRQTFIGSSDSHRADAWAGSPRTHVLLSPDQGAALRPEAVVSALRAGRTVVTGGPYIEASVTGLGPGALIPFETDLRVDVRIQAPSWVPVDRIVAVTPDGEVVVENIQSRAVVRFEGQLSIPTPERDSWFYLRADSAQSMAPIGRGLVLSVTSPFYVDRDVDGSWNP